MCPWPEDQTLRTAPGASQADMVVGRGARIGVVPARQMHDRDGGVAVVKALGVDARLLPVFVKDALRPLFEQIVLVFGGGADRRIPPGPRHPAEPRGYVLRPQRRAGLRVARVGECVAVSPGRLLQVECAAVPDAAAIGVREAAAIEELRREAGRVKAPERGLGMRGVGQPERADMAVAPGLTHQPGERIGAVLGLAEIFREFSAGAIAAAAVLIGDCVAVRDEIGGDLFARARRRVGGGALRPARGRFVVGGALEQHRKRPGPFRPVDVGRQHDLVARRRHQVALDDDLRCDPPCPHRLSPLARAGGFSRGVRLASA